MRITNLHLIVSFLFLSTVGFFAYQFLGRHVAPPLPPLQVSKPLEDDATLRLRDARRAAETSMTHAQSTLEAAQRADKDIAGAVATLDEAKRLFASARLADDFMDSAAMAEQAAQQALEARSKQLTLYVVHRGDNLWNISKKPEVYGRGAGWVKIWRANEKRIPDFDTIVSGQQLTIPR